MTNNAPIDSTRHVSWESWRPFSGFTELNHLLVDARKDLKEISNILKDAKTVIKALKALVILFSNFETLLENALYLFTQALANQLQQMLNDAESTGVYTLDLVNYHWDVKGKPQQIGELVGPWYESGITGGYDTNISNVGTVIKTRWDELANLGISYRKETYNEFINKICGCFLNEHDIPLPRGVWNKVGNGDSKWLTPLQHSFLQSGRPNFGPDATMNVLLIVFCEPDMTPFFNAYDGVSKLLSNTMRNSGNFLKTYNMAYNSTEKKLSALFKNSEKETDAYAHAFTTEMKNVLMGEDSDFSRQITKANDKVIKARSGMQPTFCGVNAYTLAGPIFDELQMGINWLRKRTYKINYGLAQSIISMLNDIESEINDLLKMIAMLDLVIQTIQLILSLTGIKLITFTTKYGNAGVVDLLKGATNFNNDTKTQHMTKQTVDLGNTIKTLQLQISSLNGSINILNHEITALGAAMIDDVNLIQNAAVDKAFYTNFAAPNTYDPSTQKITWSNYPSNIQSLYQTYVDHKAKHDANVASVTADQIQLNTTIGLLTSTNLQLANIDPVAAEQNRRAIADMKISNMQHGVQQIQILQANSKKSESNLAIILAAVQKYCVDLTNAGYATAINSLYTIQQSFNAELATNQLALNNVTALGKNKITYQNAFDQYHASPSPQDVISTTHNQTVVTINNAIAKLLPGDSSLVLNAQLIAENASYNKKIAELNADQQQTEFIILTASSNVSIAENSIRVYGIEPSEYDAVDWTLPLPQTIPFTKLPWTDSTKRAALIQLFQQTSLPVLLTNAQNQFTTVIQAAIASRQAVIDNYTMINTTVMNNAHVLLNVLVQYGINPNDPSYQTIAPWTTTLTNSQKAEIIQLMNGTQSNTSILLALNNQSIINPTAITQALGYINLSQIIPTAIPKISLDDLYVLIHNYNALIEMLTNQITINEITRVIKQRTIEHTSQVAQASQTIKTIKDGAFKTISGINSSYYLMPVNSYKDSDGSTQFETYVNNEIAYLTRRYGYNKNDPSVLVGPLGSQVIDSTKCASITSIVAALAQQAKLSSGFDLRYHAAHDDFQHAQIAEAKAEQKYTESLQFSAPWSPTMKMYYGGFLICAGWPNYDDKNYFNISNIYKQTFSDPMKQAKKTDAKVFNKEWGTIKKVFS